MKAKIEIYLSGDFLAINKFYESIINDRKILDKYYINGKGDITEKSVWVTRTNIECFK